MRSKKEIMERLQYVSNVAVSIQILTEVLIDIRDLMSKKVVSQDKSKLQKLRKNPEFIKNQKKYEELADTFEDESEPGDKQ